MATVKQLEQQFTELKAFVQARSRTWLIIAGIALVLIIVLLFTIFKNKGREGSLEKVRLLDSTIKYQERIITTLQRTIDHQDSLIMDLMDAYKKNRPTETRIIHHYDKIPNSVRDLDREQLRREVTNF